MILNNEVRIGNFTSSEIVALTTMGTIDLTEQELAMRPKKGKGSKVTIKEFGFGKAALNYIQQCNYERKLGRSIDLESNAKPLSWGKLLEDFAFNKIGIDYIITSQETNVHPIYKYWVGSKDAIKHDERKTVVDFKCPITLLSFCTLVNKIYETREENPGISDLDLGKIAISDIRLHHKDGEKFYWQLVSNACINNCKYAELIVYMPYYSELNKIKKAADGQPNMYWLSFNNNDSELPYLVDGGYYSDINVIRFEVPQSDKEFLTQRVEEAGKLLINFSN